MCVQWCLYFRNISTAWIEMWTLEKGIPDQDLAFVCFITKDLTEKQNEDCKTQEKNLSLSSYKIQRPRYFRKGQTMRGQKDAESGHILTVDEKKGGFTSEQGTDSPLSQVYKCFEAFLDKNPGVVYISRCHIDWHWTPTKEGKKECKGGLISIQRS